MFRCARRRGWSQVPCAPLLLALVAALALIAAGTAGADPLPPFDGTTSFPPIKGPSDPEEFSWQLVLGEGQAIEQLSDQAALVYYSKEHHAAFTIDADPAHDAIGVNVPTTLSVSAEDVITLTVHHREGNPLAGGAPFAYPVTAGSGWEGGSQTTIVSMPPSEANPQEAAARQEEAEACIVPKLSGDSLKAARRKLRLAHCRPGALSVRRDKRLAGARVLRERPRPGTVLTPASAVDLTLG